MREAVEKNLERKMYTGRKRIKLKKRSIQDEEMPGAR